MAIGTFAQRAAAEAAVERGSIEGLSAAHGATVINHQRAQNAPQSRPRNHPSAGYRRAQLRRMLNGKSRVGRERGANRLGPRRRQPGPWLRFPRATSETRCLRRSARSSSSPRGDAIRRPARLGHPVVRVTESPAHRSLAGNPVGLLLEDIDVVIRSIVQSQLTKSNRDSCGWH